MNFGRRNIQLFASCIFANLLLFLFLGKNGPLVQVDTANYYSAAYNLFKGNGLLLFDGEYLQNAPPLFSFIALPCYVFGIQETSYFWMVQLIAFNASVYFSYRILHLLKVFSPLLGLLFVLCFGFSWLHVWSFALSEAVFLPCLLAWIYYLLKPTKGSLYFAIVAFCLLALTRYLIWMILPGIFIPFLFVKGFWKKASISIVPGVLVSIAWWYYNFLAYGNPLGSHNLTSKFSIAAFGENLGFWLAELQNGRFSLNVAFLIYVVLAMFIGLFMLVNRAKLKPMHLSYHYLVLGMVMILPILLFLQDGLSLIQLPRYFSVLWTPMAISLLLCLDFLKSSQFFKRILLLLALFVQFSLLYVQGIKLRATSEVQVLSQLDFAQQQQEISCVLSDEKVSNFPDLVWWHTKWQCKYSPYADESRQSMSSRLGSNRSQTLIWFDNETRTGLMRSDLDWIGGDKKKPCFEKQGLKVFEIDSIFY